MEKIQQIQQMVSDGFAIRKIARELKIEIDQIKNIISKNNFELIKENFTEEEIPRIISLYKDGVSAKQLAIKYSIDKRRILKWSEQEGILRSKSESHRLKFINENIFDIIDTEEKAYWLGFLYADAYNYENKGWINLVLQLSDIDHLKKYVTFFGGDVSDIVTDKVGEDKQYEVCSYKINSKYLSKKMKELGCPQAKSFIIKYPNWLKEELHFHFIRGYFDGDGCLTFRKKQKEWKWSLMSTKEMCDEIINIFNKNDIILKCFYRSITGNNTYEIECSGNLKIRKICDLLYKNSTIYMQRKYDKYLQLKEQNEKNHIGMKQISFSEIITIDNKLMNTETIKLLSKNEKELLIKPITDYFYNNGFIYPDDTSFVNDEYKRLCDSKIDTNIIELNNTQRLGTYICKYFCDSFYNSRLINEKNIIDIFKDRDSIEKAVLSKLNLLKQEQVSFNFSYATLIDELKRLRLCSNVSIFKPNIAKYMCLKYSNEGDTIGDYSCGFGARLLGAISCNRKYIGTDPLTVPELLEMASFFNKNNDCKLIQLGSENYCGDENSIDLYWSSPPYFNLEQYSSSLNQAYNKGEEYFYNKYWRQTLQNVKYMLKPNKWFGVNIGDNYNKMADIAKEYFGPVIEEVKLVSQRSHFIDKKIKFESIYMFKNNK